MVYHHRKFISYLMNNTATDSCASYCNSSDTSSFCQPPCLTFCPSCCDEFIQSLTPSPSPVHHKSPRFLIIVATILATIFFLLLCFVIFVKIYLAPRRRSSSQPPRIINETLDDFVDEDHGPVVDHPIWYINTVGLQPSIISEITVLKYKKGHGLVEGTDCSVCLSEFQDDETLRLLPKCNHAFHISCIDTWLRSHTNCPLCRAPIVKNNRVDRPSSSSSSSPPPAAPPLESNNENLGTRGGSTQVNILVQNNGGSRREFEDEVCEGRNNNHNERDQESGDLEIEQRRKRNDQESNDEIQPIRRSVSLDSVSASKMIQGLSDSVSQEVRSNSDTHFAEEGSLSQKIVPKKIGRSESWLRFVGSSSIIGRSLQNAPVSLKRSFSCSGKFLLSRSR